ncbi:BrnT family toxin [Endozoicomonas sp. 4G]|uniref:BrnT family toxin n=1 Tax=Endozoicomonas sp. 4G TaxID=2872754 RepID=UPI002078D47C|nr:BrnT family toxin [Endozoicomonas sp. 4G]
MIKFEWDQVKSRSNQRKHGVSFEEAKSVFYDEYAVQFYDEENSEAEDRFLMVGLSQESRVLLVCHCERDDGQSIRIISARKATHNERRYYEGILS